MIKNTNNSNPVSPVEKLSRPFLHFLHIESSGGIVLLLCTVVALFFANSPWASAYADIWNIPMAISFGDFVLSHSIGHWINDALMTIFFFVVGLEIKRELVVGELKNKKAAILPIAAAFGGMLVPALLYVLIIGGEEGSEGWGVPMATDIAFVVGFLSLLGKRIPHGLKIFILSLAIIDDLGAILIIAAVYSTKISFGALLYGFLGLFIIVLLNRIGVRRVQVYVFVGILIWFSFLMSGIHPTIAGVLLGILTPASAWIGDRTFLDVISSFHKTTTSLESDSSKNTNGTQLNDLIFNVRETVSPLERLELALHPIVAFAIMPLFALANAGVPLTLEATVAPVSIAILIGLMLGKPLGIVFFSWLSVKLLRAKLPEGVNWWAILGAGSLAGIGFTMSIFIAGLALSPDMLSAGKIGTLIGSALSAIIGLTLLSVTFPRLNKQE